MVKAFACRTGLLAFAATALDAAWQGLDLGAGLSTALLCLMVFYALGALCGGLACQLADEQSQQLFDRWKAEADATADAR